MKSFFIILGCLFVIFTVLTYLRWAFPEVGKILEKKVRFSSLKHWEAIKIIIEIAELVISLIVITETWKIMMRASSVFVAIILLIAEMLLNALFIEAGK